MMASTNKQDSMGFRAYLYMVLGWFLVIVLLVLGWLDSSIQSQEMMSLLKENISVKIELIRVQSELPELLTKTAAFESQLTTLLAARQAHLHEVQSLNQRTKMIEADIESRVGQRWNLPDQILWVKELRDRNREKYPDFYVPPANPEKLKPARVDK